MFEKGLLSHRIDRVKPDAGDTPYKDPTDIDDIEE